MASHYKIQKKWIDNFTKSPFVNRSTGKFKKEIAIQCFHGKSEDAYDASYPENFDNFYNTHYLLGRLEAVEITLKFLHFIGIKLNKHALVSHLETFPDEYHKVLKKCYYLFRTMTNYNETLDIHNPYHDNYWDIQYFIKIESGQTQLAIFHDADLPELYNKVLKLPDGYDSDEVITELFKDIENSNDSFFITGKAGTGKSTFIHYFTQKTSKKVLLTAFTGIAAINVGGVTIHSFFKFPLRSLLPGDEEIKIFHEDDQRRKIITEIDTIIIDEISMLRADLLEAIDYSLRKNGGDAGMPFGGKQILFVGDLFQLPPVTDSSEVDRFIFKEIFNSPYFFDSRAYNELNPKFFEFKKPKRQKDDLEFVKLLDSVRVCEISDSNLDKLNQQVNPNYVPDSKDFVITLTVNNAIANEVNEHRLNELPFTKHIFNADIKGEFDENRFATSPLLELKQKAQVIFIKNDSTGQKRWVNGTIGKIEFITDDMIEVMLPDKSVHEITRETWEFRGYKYDKSKRKVTSEVKGTFTQFPIRLAWAITIHKSQGLTFDKVVVDLGSGTFVNGQLYTALSRCRKLDGLILKRKIKQQDVIHDKRLIEFYNSLLSSTNNTNQS
ncbi:MAG TPA: AAA family ATPase [Cyclobacteriaceae bacterium]|nr:AAA family ATPase [Cyclobacteriaceae bacterium]